MIDNEPLRAKLRTAIGATATHVDCPCWKTGVFDQVPCPWHDGKDKFPIGAYAKSQKAMGETGGEMANESDDFAVVERFVNRHTGFDPIEEDALAALARIHQQAQERDAEIARLREDAERINFMALTCSPEMEAMGKPLMYFASVEWDEHSTIRQAIDRERLTAEAKPEAPATEPYSDTMPLLTRVLIHEAEEAGAESPDPKICTCPVHAQLEAVNAAIHPPARWSDYAGTDAGQLEYAREEVRALRAELAAANERAERAGREIITVNEQVCAAIQREYDTAQAGWREAIDVARRLKGFIRPFALDDMSDESEYDRYTRVVKELAAIVAAANERDREKR